MSQRGSTIIIILLVAIMVVLLGAAGVGAYIILRSQGHTAAPLPVQPPTSPPQPVAPPVQPNQPAQPPAPPAASDLISKLELVATSPTEVPPGQPVKFKMTYVVSGSEKVKVESQLAWRIGSGELNYSKVFAEEATPGAFTSDGWSLKSNNVGDKFAVYAVVKAAGKTLISQTPVMMTVTGAAAPPQPPSQPAASDAIGDLKLVAVSPTEVPPGEPVNFEMTFVYNRTEKSKIEAQFAYKIGSGELTYGKIFADDVVPGPNASKGWSFKSGEDAGTKITLFAVVRTEGKVFISQAGVTMTVISASAQPAPQPPAAPQPTFAPQPPAVPQPAPPSGPVPPPVGPVPKPGPAAPVTMQTYRDPGGRFEMDYPVGWRTQLLEGGFISFYKDHPQEGTAFVHNPWADLRGTHGGREIAQLFIENMRSRYPDLQVLGQDIKPLGRSGPLRIDAAIMETAWTNVRGERMRGRVAIVATAITLSGMPATTTIHYWAYQAPEVTWDAMQQTFIQMYQSWSGKAYVSSPP